MDDIFDVLTDYTVGDKRPSTAAFITALALVLGAALLFALVYARRKRVVQQRDTLERLNLIRQGRLDLRRRCLRPDGSVRRALFCANESSEHEQEPNESEEKPKTIGNQLFETLTSGKLVNMINNFHVKKKKIDKRMENTVSPLERYQMEREARLADETVNPLYRLKRTRCAAGDAQSDSDSDSDSDETSVSSLSKDALDA